MRVIFKILFVSPLILIFVCIIWANLNLRFTPRQAVINGELINVEVLSELRFLKQALSENKDRQMQSIYPEGYVFLNAIYALAWSNYLDHVNSSTELRKEGMTEIDRAWQRIDSKDGRAPFEIALPLPYGAFYTGWSNYVLGRKLELETSTPIKAEEIELFKNTCDSIALALKPNTYPVTYSGLAWPADVTVCVASLALHDRIFEPRYQLVIGKWIVEVRAHLDTYGLIPHEVAPETAEVIEHARGSSQGLILLFLREIDSQFAKEQFLIYKRNFLSRRLGVTAVREYPLDKFGIGDVDSGPLLMQFGSAATIVGFQTCFLYGDQTTATLMRNAIEGAAMPLNIAGKKRYLFGIMPMADAFIAWGHSVEENERTDIPLSFAWLHFFSLVICLLLGVAAYYLLRTRKSSHNSLHIPWE